MVNGRHKTSERGHTHSCTEMGLGTSSRELWFSGTVVGESGPSSKGDGSGVGLCKVTLVTMEKGALCGRGEMSIASTPYAGDEEGIGGVVPPSQRRGGVVVPSM